MPGGNYLERIAGGDSPGARGGTDAGGEAVGAIDADAGGPGRARYVAIITDGNGRWAHQRGLPVIAGHEAGADVVKARVRDCVDFGVQEFTVFSFSTENWRRSKLEVAGLLAMFMRRIEREVPAVHAEGVRIRCIGLIIRTSGERRLSNYLLWQGAYAELVFRDELWPDFTRGSFEECLAEFAVRQRRFGGR